MTSSAWLAFKELGLSPKKSFGQNFLVDKGAARKIAELAAEGPATIVEIGAGLGALTEPLLAQGAKVAAVERDRDLCPLLRDAFASWIEQGQLVVIEADAKRVDYGELLRAGPAPRVLVGNLPYQLTGPLLQRTTELASVIDRAIYTVQAEVGERLTAAPGSDAYGALTVFASAAFRITRAFALGPGAFFPRPSVDSAVLLFVPLRPPRAKETDRFRAVVRGAFAQRRKTLRNAWSSLGTAAEIAGWADAAGIDLGRRGETLSVEEFARFTDISSGQSPER
jgi:16S rRNA (adenine1518-N6/adenine1519-N6)-dimethyltransferase